jgi:acetyl esterase/lipase
VDVWRLRGASLRALRGSPRVAWVVVAALLLAGCLVPPGNHLPAAPAVRAPDFVSVSYGPLDDQLLDITLPATGHGPFPVLLYLHSGGWSSGSRRIVPDPIRAVADHEGAALVSVDYRLVSTTRNGTLTNTFPTQHEDTDRAIRFIRANAATWGLDPNMIVVAGASAGGQLALMAGAAPGAFTDPTLPIDQRVVSPDVQGVLDMVGPSDFSTWGDAASWAPGLLTSYLDCPTTDPVSCDPAIEHQASIAGYLAPGVPPAYLAYGAQDTLVPPSTQGLPLARQWAAARGESGLEPTFARGTWYEYTPDAGHNFDLDNSSTATMALWLSLVFTHELH